jgi:methionyl-tRNA formyltransferase
MRSDVEILHRVADAKGGDMLLLVSCQEIIEAQLRESYRHSLVIHASDLPLGRGMSPHVWQILEGKTKLAVTLLEVVDRLDAGDIWCQEHIHIPATALHDEIHRRLFDAELRLMSWALENHTTVQPRVQSGESSYYRKRTPEDSRIDLDSTLGAAFNQLLVADPLRYPAFFEYEGARFKIVIERM